MTNKILSLCLMAIILLKSSLVLANPWTLVVSSENKGRVTTITKGEKAPFDGTLFDNKATSQLIVDKESAEAKCKIEIEKAVSEERAKGSLAITNLRAEKEAIENREKGIVDLKNDQIEFLTKQLEQHTVKPKRNWAPLWFSGGVIGGIIITAVSAYAFSKIN